MKTKWSVPERSAAEPAAEGRELAYKAVLIVALCVSITAWTSMLSAFPLVYEYVRLANRQFDNVVEFCEFSAASVRNDTAGLLRQLLAMSRHARTDLFGNRTRVARQIPVTLLQSHSPGCRCEAEAGAAGAAGRRGLRGVQGRPGAAGIPARLPCEPLKDLKRFCPEQCPAGLQGLAGARGERGEKGAAGERGAHGHNGEHGGQGPRGQPGPPGVDGVDGDDGENGADAQPTPFIPGPPGPLGEQGEAGPAGPRGMPGVDGPQGPAGKRGTGGANGVPGARGTPGPPGPMGDQGEHGKQGVCPTYCATDGGVFFVEPPDWFFNQN